MRCCVQPSQRTTTYICYKAYDMHSLNEFESLVPRVAAFELAAFVRHLEDYPDWGFLAPLRTTVNPDPGSVKPTTEAEKELVNILARVRAHERERLFTVAERLYREGRSYDY